jgi:hypothetical protein
MVAVGNGAEATFGSSLVRPRSGAITSRRIDLRTDIPDFLNAALPHEICHLLVADGFRDRPAPLWYDEGLALLADAPAKRRLHQRDLEIGIRQGTTFRLVELLSAERYPSADRMGVFYGQCASLTQFLLEESPPERIHDLAAQTQIVGVSAALRQTYGVTPQLLERRWLQWGHDAPKGQQAASLASFENRGERFSLVAQVNRLP